MAEIVEKNGDGEESVAKNIMPSTIEKGGNGKESPSRKRKVVKKLSLEDPSLT